MPIGPNGEKRSADVIANAVLVGRVATRQTGEQHVHAGGSESGRKGGKARAEALSAERRGDVVKEGAKARWGSHAPVRQGRRS